MGKLSKEAKAELEQFKKEYEEHKKKRDTDNQLSDKFSWQEKEIQFKKD